MIIAEYIEREALLSELQEEIDFETSMYTDEQNKYFNMGLKCAVRDVKSQPTADVVPKSEVARLEGELIVERTRRENAVNAYHDTKSEVERWRRNLEAVLEERAETKSEVAREIFEEIDAIIFGTIIPNDCAIISIAKLAELKKKYTGEQT